MRRSTAATKQRTGRDVAMLFALPRAGAENLYPLIRPLIDQILWVYCIAISFVLQLLLTCGVAATIVFLPCGSTCIDDQASRYVQNLPCNPRRRRSLVPVSIQPQGSNKYSLVSTNLLKRHLEIMLKLGASLSRQQI